MISRRTLFLLSKENAPIHTSQLFRWRQQLCERTQIPAAFNPVAIAPEPGTVPPPSPESAGVIEIEIEFATGGRMRIVGLEGASMAKVPKCRRPAHR